MTQLGLIRTDLLRYLKPDLSEEALAAIEEVGAWVLAGLYEYRKPDDLTLAEERKLALQAFARELKTLAAWFFEEFDEIRSGLAEDGPEGWLLGYYTDWGIRLERHLTTLAVRIEGGLSPSRETLIAWRASLPNEVPPWGRGATALEFPPALRPPVVLPEGFVAAEARAETAVLAELLEALATRAGLIATSARNSLPREEGAGRDLEDLQIGLGALRDLLTSAAKQAWCVVEGDSSGEED